MFHNINNLVDYYQRFYNFINAKLITSGASSTTVKVSQVLCV